MTTLSLRDLGFVGGLSGFLLDTYTGAAAAYSLRQLKTGVGNVILVRRSSDNAEAEFTSIEVTNGTLTSWVGGSNNGYVKTWYDQSGNGADATNTNTSTQPSIVSGGALVTVNTKPAIEFATKILVSTPSLSAAPQSNTFVCVHNANGTPSTGQAAFSFASGSSRNQGIIMQQNQGLQPCMLPKPAYPMSQSLIIYAQNTTADILSLNGALQSIDSGTQSNVNTVFSGSFDIGRRNVGNISMNCFHQELIIYPNSQASNRVAMEAEINKYYSIY